MRYRRNRQLVDTNIIWLRQALQLVRDIDDRTFATAPALLPGHRAGSHLRHILEFYECFLNGLETGRIDYDARSRNQSLECRRDVAEARVESLLHRLESSLKIRDDSPLLVWAEDAPADRAEDYWLRSSICRELQALSNHTVHHFAVIAVTLQAHGIMVDPHFGVSPSTLRFRRSQLGVDAAAA